MPLSARGEATGGATNGAHAALSATLGATLDGVGSAAERAENAARFSSIVATWTEAVDAALVATFASLDALRDQVAEARKLASPAQLAAASAVSLDVEKRSFGASKTLSSDWKEGKDVGQKLAKATATHIAGLASSGAPITESAIATINRMVRPDSAANARGVCVGAYRAPGISKETAFLKRCVPPRHVPDAMRQVVAFLDDAARTGMHPIERAGRAYHALVNIHAYSDGNGRTSRAVMDWILQSAGFPPVALNDAKVLSFDTDTMTTTPGMPNKAVHEVVAALTTQLTATLQALTSTSPPATTATTTFTALKNGAPAFTNRDYLFIDVPAAFAGHRIEAHAGGDVGPRRWAITDAGPLFVAAAPSQDKNTSAALQAAGFSRTKHTFRYSDKQKTVVEVWRKDVRAGDVIDVVALGWAGVRRIVAAR